VKTLRFGTRLLLAVLLAGGISTVPAAAAGQSLYLITGPTDSSGAPVYLLPAKLSQLSLLQTVLVKPVADDACAVSIDPKERIASALVEAVDGSGAEARTVDMDDPEFPQATGVLYGTQPGMRRNCMSAYLIRTPDSRLLQAIELGPEYRPCQHPNRSPASAFSLIGFQVRPYVKEPKLEQLPWSYYARIEVSNFGFNHGAHYLPEVRVGPDGVLNVVTFEPANLPYSVNRDILAKVGVDNSGGLGAFDLEVSTPQWLALRRTRDRKSVPDGIGLSHHDVLDKSSKTWETFEVPGSESILKNFGDWFATTVIVGNSHKESPGKSNRRPSSMRNAFHVDYLFESEELYSPGQLYLVNARTRQSYRIVTNEGDSEVLLIEDGVIYYRVNDSVFQAPIGPKSIGTPALMASDNLVPDVHWAFFEPAKTHPKRPSSPRFP
jgi:hypothetical protein